MFGDVGWAELLLVGIVALIVIGPEDLPQMFRQLGRFTAKLKAMSRDFSRAMEQAAKESGVKDVTDSVKGATSATSLGLNKVKAAADRFEKWDPMKAVVNPTGAKPLVPAAMPATADVAISQPVVVSDPEPTIHGAETQALIKKQAAKKAVLMQTAEKLKAIQAGTDDTPPPKPKPARVAPKPAAVETAAAVAKPRAPRKSKKADDQ